MCNWQVSRLQIYADSFLAWGLSVEPLSIFFLSCDTPFKCGEMAGFRNRILRSVDCIAGRQQELISTSMLHQTSLELSEIIKHGPIAESNRWVRLKMRYISISPVYVNIQTGKMMIMMTNQVPTSSKVYLAFRGCGGGRPGCSLWGPGLVILRIQRMKNGDGSSYIWNHMDLP